MDDHPVEVFLGVGSNVAPEENLPRALAAVSAQLRLIGVSTVYRTAAIDRPGQAPFLNGVWRVETVMAARVLKFDVLRHIESDLGRVRTADRYADRTIDLDILLYGDAVINEPGLRVPDPDIRSRAFIAVPLLELAPDLVLPGTGEPLREVVARMDCSGLEAVPELGRLLGPDRAAGAARG